MIMIKRVMIQLGAKNLKSSCRMMIETVMIQLGHLNRKGGGGGHQRGTGDAEDAGSQGQKPTGKAEDAKSQSQKAATTSGTGNAEDAKSQPLKMALPFKWAKHNQSKRPFEVLETSLQELGPGCPGCTKSAQQVLRVGVPCA